MNSDQVLGIIPARSGSKRFPRKNLALLAGKPLLFYAIEAGLQSEKLDRLVISSEDDEILSLAASISSDLPLRRPDHLAQDTSLVYNVTMDVLAQLESRGEGPYAYVVILQCTSPFTTAADIDGTIKLFLNSDAESACTIVELDHFAHPMKLKRFKGGWLLPFLSSEEAMQPYHELPRLFVRNGSVYASRREVLENGALIGERCLGYLMPRERSVDINTPFDLTFAEFLLSLRRDSKLSTDS